MTNIQKTSSSAPAMPISILKATYLQDLNSYIVHIEDGYHYKIDGQMYKSSYNRPVDVQVDDLSIVKRVLTSTIVTHYIKRDDENHTISVDQHEEELHNLQSKGRYDEDQYDYAFDDLDDEYAYKKFKRLWIPITRSIISHESDVEFDVTNSVYDTGNRWITSLFDSSKASERGLVRLNRIGVQREAFNEIVVELDISDHVTIPTHSHLRFVQLYGNYSFDESWSDKQNGPVILTLADAKNKANEDRDRVRQIVLAAYNRKMGTVNMGQFPWDELLASLSRAQTNIKAVKTSVRTSSEYRHAQTNLNDAIKLVTKGLANK